MTPMLQQYQSIKEQYPDTILFFRLGDFYELFFADAESAAPILGVALTRRGQVKERAVPMCGVPYHAAETYIAKLLKEGISVAICDQVESVEDAKKRGAGAIVRRDVVRVMTPGTVVEDNLLTAQNHNYLMAVHMHRNAWCVSYMDLSVGDFYVEECGESDLENILGRIRPKEVIIAATVAQQDWLIKLCKLFKCYISIQPDVTFSPTKGRDELMRLLGVRELDGVGTLSSMHVMTAGAVAHYVFLTHKEVTFNAISLHVTQDAPPIMVDHATMSSLEIFETNRGERKGSLLHHINHTCSPGGTRLLMSDLLNPLRDQRDIEKRLDQIEWCIQQDGFLVDWRQILATMGDTERVLSRLNIGRMNPRDVAHVRVFLNGVERLYHYMHTHDALMSGGACREYYAALGQYPKDLHALLDCALVDDVPPVLGSAPVIATGYDEQLDALRASYHNVDQRIQDLERQYTQETGVSIRIRSNNVTGYFIEVSKKNAPRMSTTFIQKQTLVNTVRFTTEALQTLEAEAIQASHLHDAHEEAVFSGVVQAVCASMNGLRRLVQICARLDVIMSHAQLHSTYGFTRPNMTSDSTLSVEGGWHPVLANMMDAGTFVHNDCHLMDGSVHVITGPNMGGKSTFLRQNALIILLAHVGSYVPAKAARIGVVDRIFSRVGASDDLTKGRSTFMVEMLETALILNQSTQKSFMILDEVGRGTSTHDGVALAWAMTEYIHDRIGSRCLFATHYHELADLAWHKERVKNYCAEVREWEGGVSFDYKIVEGFAQRSYGLHVARQAGVPADVVSRAHEILGQLSSTANVKEQKSAEPSPTVSQTDVVCAWARTLALDTMTPKQVFDLVYDYAHKLQGDT